MTPRNQKALEWESGMVGLTRSKEKKRIIFEATVLKFEKNKGREKERGGLVNKKTKKTIEPAPTGLNGAKKRKKKVPKSDMVSRIPGRGGKSNMEDFWEGND